MIQIFEPLAKDELKHLTICANSPDYAGVMEIVRNKNIPINIAGFRETMATELQWGNVIWIDDFWHDIKKTPMRHA